jgi:perosamine synthetase
MSDMEVIDMKFYPYGHQCIDDNDVAAVAETLKSDFLTTGPKVSEFEKTICKYTGAKYCVAVSNATAGLHIAALAANFKPDDEVITSPITFLSSANCARFVGADVVFADIDAETACIDPEETKKRITQRTKGIVAVHYAGQSCDMEKIAAIAKEHNLVVIEDAAHAMGSDYHDTKVGCCKYSDMTVFSFHPVKTVTTGEGGAVTTNSAELYEKLCAFRAHGIYREKDYPAHYYEMRELGYNYRMTDFQAALGISQMAKLDKFKTRRRAIVDYYNKKLELPHLVEREYSTACFHLYPVLVENRDDFFTKAHDLSLGVQVHYIPVHTQPYYRQFGYNWGDYPKAEEYYKHTVSLPLYPALTDDDLDEIIRRIKSFYNLSHK